MNQRSKMRARLDRIFSLPDDARPRIYAAVSEDVGFGRPIYWLELLFAAGIATLGLVQDSAAVVIGAMLVSPLMGPIIAAGLALAAADLYLAIRAFLTLVASILLSVLFSAALVWALPYHSVTPQILARTQPTLLDLGVALFSGLAGAIVVCRGHAGGGVTALPGVAIAVALMPPLCTVGFGLGSGGDWAIMNGAMLLFATNLAAIIASAFFVFLLVRMNAEEVRQRIGYGVLERASHDRLYQLLERTHLFRSVGVLGKLRWRILLPVLALGSLAVPLWQSLLRVRDDVLDRSAVRHAVADLAPPNSILTRQVETSDDAIAIHLSVAGEVPPKRIEEAEEELRRARGKPASITVRQVAGREEVARLRERLNAPPPPPPKPSFADSGADLTERAGRALQEVWPAAAGELASYEVVLGGEAPVLRLTYVAPRRIDAATTETLTSALRALLEDPRLLIEAEYRRPAARRRSR